MIEGRASAWRFARLVSILALATLSVQSAAFAQSLSLESVIQRARAAPDAVLATVASQQAEREHVGAARAAYWPRLSVSVNGTVTHQELLSPPPTASGGTQAFSALAQVDWMLFDFGRRAAALSAAEHASQAALEEIEIARRRAVLIAVESFFRVLAQDQVAKTYEGILERRQAIHRTTQVLAHEHLRPEVDAQRAELEVNGVATELEALRLQQRLERVRLAVALGYPASASLTLRPPMTADELPADAESPRVIDALTCKDPEISAAQQRLASSAARTSEDERSLLPTLSLQTTVGYNRLAELYGTPAPPPINVEATAFEASAVLVLRWDAIDPVMWQRSKASARAEQSARYQLADVRAHQELQGYQTLSEALQSRARLRQVDRALEVSKLAFRQQEARYRNGLASLLELLDSEGQLQKAELDGILSRLERDIADVKLRVLGERCTPR